jgi:hypothetical protein
MKKLKELDSRKINGKTRKFSLYICTKCGLTKESRSDAKHTTELCRVCSNTTHGEEHTKLYSIWLNMRSRCYNTNNTRYQSYGGRGIKVCKKWEKFEEFSEWAKTNGYVEINNRKNELTTLDRIDNDKGYSPNNCRWVPQKEQMKNRQLLQKNNKSGYRGVHIKENKYQAIITVGSKRLYSPRFKEAKEAALWREARIYFYGLSLQKNWANLKELPNDASIEDIEQILKEL